MRIGYIGTTQTELMEAILNFEWLAHLFKRVDFEEYLCQILAKYAITCCTNSQQP